METGDRNRTIKNRISRRDFARDAALAAAGIAALPCAALARGEASTPHVSEEPPQSDDKKLSPASQAEVDAKLEIIFKKYGSRLSETQKSDLRRLASEGQKPLEAIRAYSVEDSNQPATVLKLYPEAGAAQHGLPAGSASGPAKKE